MPEAQEDVLLRLSGIGKKYPGVIALDGVDLEFRRGELHALCGENGAGKSTLSKIIAGIVTSSAGEMFFRGSRFEPEDKRDAEELGIRMVMQELNLISTLTVAENIFLNRMPSRMGLLDRKRLKKETQALLNEVGLERLDTDAMVSDLGVGQQQMVEIAAGFSQKCELLILDEPTASLTDSERELLFVQIERLKKEGVCIIYISHRMEEIKRISDRITILRDGVLRGTRNTDEVDTDEIIRMMVGREVGGALVSDDRKVASELALRVKGIGRGRAARDVSFDLRKGEILGFAGMMGSGRTELMRLIFGADPKDAGEVYIGDDKSPVAIGSPKDAVRAGLAMLTEDRKEQGLLLPQAISVNTSLARLAGVASRGWIRRDEEVSVA
ncbi:MAG: sugar ABC transporter ATP-binding protein, partial [Verrucomicrobiota bacterium]